jgi:hypothetical protein
VFGGLKGYSIIEEIGGNWRGGLSLSFELGGFVSS